MSLAIAYPCSDAHAWSVWPSAIMKRTPFSPLCHYLVSWRDAGFWFTVVTGSLSVVDTWYSHSIFFGAGCLELLVSLVLTCLAVNRHEDPLHRAVQRTSGWLCFAAHPLVGLIRHDAVKWRREESLRLFLQPISFSFALRYSRTAPSSPHWRAP